ncbi:MAG: hypothetical protein R3F25_08600 [Gammaproteobacteria bacterium]|jgi:hypothetical protein|nr:hypothetical protein [Xanthomonadales bacterium]
MYKIIFIKTHNTIKLSLESTKKVIRQWCGQFAELIFYQEFQGSNTHVKSTHTLQKNQVRKLFLNITCLHQKLIYKYNIDSDLRKIKIPKNLINIVKSLLLQIRINSSHSEYSELKNYYIDEFLNYNMGIFDDTLDILVANKLIQAIYTDDGKLFFDKNTQPHNHIYFSQYKKLVDCSTDMTDFFLKNNIMEIKKDSNGQVFTLYTTI